MKPRIFFLPLFLLLSGLSSCERNDDISESGAFKYKGVAYETLQQAVDASLADPDPQGFILLLRDARGNGAKVDDGKDKLLLIDFDRYGYELVDGQKIEAGKTFVTLSGNGGALSGTGTILVSEREGRLSISDDLDITGCLETSSCTIFENAYSGTFSGNITLSHNELLICTEKGHFDIPVLNVDGKDSFLQVETSAAPEEQIRIGKLVSSADRPVMANFDGSVTIGSGGRPHIHTFTVEEIPATCTMSSRIEKTCTECGYVYSVLKEGPFGKCPAQSLVHVAGFPETDTGMGMIEHWECPYCGKCYSDANGTDEITGPVSILPKNYQTEPSLFSSPGIMLSWRNEFPGPLQIGPIALAIITTAIGLAATLGIGIPPLCSDYDTQFADMNYELALIQESLNQIEAKLDELMRKIDVVPYKTFLADRNKELQFLLAKSATVFNRIGEYLKDPSLSTEQKIERVTLSIEDWSENVFGGTNIADMTLSLMQQFVSTGLDANVPQMLEAIANCSYMWEHEGYDFRYQTMVRDFMLVTISYILSCNYIASIKTYRNEDLRSDDLKFMKDCFSKYSDAILADLNRIKERDGILRRYNPEGVTIDLFVKEVNFRKWFEGNRNACFPRLNNYDLSVKSCNKMLSDLGLWQKIALSKDMAAQVYSRYNKNNPNPVSIYTILRDSIGFRHMPDKYNPGVLFVNRTDGFNHIDGEDCYPTYNIFRWEIYRCYNYEDIFGIRSGLNDKAQQGNYNFLEECDISSYGGGEINSIGKKTNWEFYTLVKLE